MFLTFFFLLSKILFFYTFFGFLKLSILCYELEPVILSDVINLNRFVFFCLASFFAKVLLVYPSSC